MDRGLWQEHVAKALGVSVSTVCNWEMNRTSVATRYLPKVVSFLGYDPREASEQIGDRIRILRERQGLSQAALAEQLGLNASADGLLHWAAGEVM